VFPTAPPPPRRLLVFARVPEPGKVKTRLAKTIGDEKALAVYEAMLRDVMSSIGASDSDLEIEIFWAPTETANGEMLHRAFGDRALAMQTGATLGERMAMAMSERFFFHRAQTIIAIGVDDPRLTREQIDHAFSLLDSCEWVVGPAVDGGYYLIGCRAAAFDASLFRDIEWGSDSVLKTTVQRIRDREDCLALLPLRYDIDVEDDLRRFASERADGALATLLREWGWAA
jgi:rSAM/selenodomain-associated transferase 1